jgi:hypothetical protein
MSKTVTDYLGTMCPGPLPRKLLEEYAKDPAFIGLVFCDRCWNIEPLSKEGVEIFIKYGQEAFGIDFQFNPLTHYFITSNCPACNDGVETTSAHYGTAMPSQSPTFTKL